MNGESRLKINGHSRFFHAAALLIAIMLLIGLGATVQSLAFAPPNVGGGDGSGGGFFLPGNGSEGDSGFDLEPIFPENISTDSDLTNGSEITIQEPQTHTGTTTQPRRETSHETVTVPTPSGGGTTTPTDGLTITIDQPTSGETTHSDGQTQTDTDTGTTGSTSGDGELTGTTSGEDDGWFTSTESDSTPTTDSTTDSSSTLTEDGTTTDDSQTPTTDGGTSTTEQNTDDNQQGEFDIQLNPSPVPGQTVTVTVTKNGQTANDIWVYFNGEHVGVTNADGQTEGTVPYTTELTVSVEDPNTDVANSIGGNVPHDANKLYNIQDTTFEQAGDDRVAETQTFNLTTGITIATDGPLLPDNEMDFTVTKDGSPITGLVFYVNNERVGVTGTDGSVSAQIPDGEQGTIITTRAERDGLTLRETFEMEGIAINFTPSSIVAIPGGSATISIETTNGEPLKSGSVVVYSGAVGTGYSVAEKSVGEDGSVDIPLPTSTSATVQVSSNGITTVEEVSYLPFFALTTLGMLVILGIVVGLIVILRRREITITDLFDFISEQTNELLGWFVDIALSVSQLHKKFRQWGIGVWDAVRVRVRNILSKLASGSVQLKQFPVAFIEWLLSIPVRIKRVLLGVMGNDVQDETDIDISDVTDLSPTERLLRYWQWFARSVSGRGKWRTQTVVEVSDKAIEKGFPESPVKRLKESVQETLYGPTVAEQTIDEADDAIEELQPTDQNNSPLD